MKALTKTDFKFEGQKRKALTKTDFKFEGQKSVYHGKVRDVYNINDDLMVMVATDRISAFDVVLPKGIPFKGQVLNQIAAKFLDATTDICPNWKLATPDPMVTVGLKCEGFRVEMIIRSILTGSAWREYKNGCRELCGVKLPDGMRENERFPEPIITPTTKADEGHDMNISKEEIIAQGIVYRRLPPSADLSSLTPSMNLVSVMERFTSSTRSTPPTQAATSMPTATRRSLLRASHSANCRKSSYVSGSSSTTL